jgi:putative copper resistance protein D
MMMGWIEWGHVLAGIGFAGGQLVFGGILWPALLRLPAREARAVLQAMGPFSRRFMSTCALFTLGLGLLRGTVYGPIRSMDTLLGTPYGHTFMAALVGMILLQAWGIVGGGKLIGGLFSGDEWSPGASTRVMAFSSVSLLLVVMLITCMLSMRYGGLF